jgi:small subunit ribosomal protein S17
MADDETTQETPTDDAPEAVVDEPTPEPEATEEPAAEAAAPDEPAAAAPEADEPEADAPAPAAEEPPAEPEEKLSPKERRIRERSRHTGDVRPTRTPEERHAERAEVRKAKAVARTRRRGQERDKARAVRAAAPAVETPPREHGPGKPKLRQGIVVSDRADKTITVRIDSARRHRRYDKILRRSTTLHAHDERNDANIGDRVRVIESRPLSATKRWRLVEIMERAK